MCKLFTLQGEGQPGTALGRLEKFLETGLVGGQLTAAGQAVAVHLRYHRFGQVPYFHPALDHVPRPLAVTGGGLEGVFLPDITPSQIITRRETAAGATKSSYATPRSGRVFH